MGLAPARLANAASERTRPRCDQVVWATAAVTGPMPRCSSSTLTGLWLSRLLIRLDSVLSSSSRACTRLASLVASPRAVEVARASARERHAGDLSDLTCGQRPSRVHPQVGDAQQRCKGVDRCRALAGHVLSRGEQDADRGSDAVVGAGLTQRVGL